MPIDLRQAFTFEKRVDLGKRFAAQETSRSGKGGWVSGFDDEMAVGIDQLFLLPSWFAPQNKRNVLRHLTDYSNYLVREFLPALLAM